MSLVYISSIAAASSATISFTDIDDAYNEYHFYFINMHPQTDSVYPKFQASVNNGSGYGIDTSTSYARADKPEADSGGTLAYVAGYDSTADTGLIQMAEDTGSDADQCWNGVMKLFNPSSTVYVKHFTIESQGSNGGNISNHQLIGGYVNTASAVDAIQFSFHSGNIQSGTIHLYGVK